MLSGDAEQRCEAISVNVHELTTAQAELGIPRKSEVDRVRHAERLRPLARPAHGPRDIFEVPGLGGIGKQTWHPLGDVRQTID